jgi:hypothetical protein
MGNWIIRIAATALFLATMMCGSASAQSRGYGGSSSYSGGHYQGAHSGQGAAGYHYGATRGSSSYRSNGAYAGRSYSGSSSHPSSAGTARSYESYSAHNTYSSSRHHYSDFNGLPERSANDARYFVSGTRPRMTMNPEIQPRMGKDVSRIGGFSSADSVRHQQVQHPTHLRQSRDTGAKKSSTRVSGIRTAPSTSATKTYDKPINLASRNEMHMPGAGAHSNPNP